MIVFSYFFRHKYSRLDDCMYILRDPVLGKLNFSQHQKLSILLLCVPVLDLQMRWRVPIPSLGHNYMLFTRY